MRLIRRPLIPGEPDPELLWGSLLGCSALLAGGGLLSGLPSPRCPLHALTGFPCPTCGATRSASALLHGDPFAAWRWNPLLSLVMAGAAVYTIYAAVVVIGRLPRLRWSAPTRSESLGIRFGIILVITANWAYLIWRGV